MKIQLFLTTTLTTLSVANTFVNADFIYTVVCSVLVFCFFNFRKKAKCFAGDVGSVSIAFILLFLIGRLIIETEDFSWIVLFIRLWCG